jgi:hypothetical protein
MTDAAKLLLTAVLAAALAGALLGPPPAAPRRTTAACLALGGCALYVLALIVALEGYGAVGTVLVGPGVGLLALAGWLSRGSDDGGGDDDRTDEPELPPIDWDDFDRLREEWARTGPRVLILS